MSSEIAVLAEDISKRYRIGATQGVARYRSLREELSGLGKRRKAEKAKNDFWALRDVSFQIASGETVGIIGRNGAGKSTMLKILAGITTPTSGRGETRGRVGSLLEVGTGFHPELTGRENIQLSAAIMGMRRAETAERFDQIVEFSGLATFLDTPVKRYSSGMYMRLAFSVAAHLEPEILLVDEVLAVGDADFQKKCLGKMGDLSDSGRTVLFISHSMPSVLRLCPRVLLLDGGHLTADGSGPRVIEEYLGRGAGAAERVWNNRATAPGDDRIRLAAVRVVDSAGVASADVDIREPIVVEIDYWNLTDDPSFRPLANMHVFNGDGTLLFATIQTDRPLHSSVIGPRLVQTRCTIPGNFLAEGSIFIRTAVTSLSPTVIHAVVHDVVAFHVVDPSAGDGARGDWVGDFPGVVRPLLHWSTSEEPIP